jgi:hypothetical protein
VIYLKSVYFWNVGGYSRGMAEQNGWEQINSNLWVIIFNNSIKADSCTP